MKAKMTGLVHLAKTLTVQFGKPKDQIQDASCLRGGCHNIDDLSQPDKIIYKEKISFNHKKHLGTLKNKMKLRCVSCHSQIVQGKHITVTESVCFLCHFKGEVSKSGENLSVQDRCATCHGAPEKVVVHDGIEFSHEEYLKSNVDCFTCHSGVTKGEGDVSKQRCAVCHVQEGHIERYEDKEFMHLTHVTENKVECFECHQNIEHGIKEMAATIEMDCSRCHQNQHTVSQEMYMGMGIHGVKSQPSAMFKTNVDCNACHRYDKISKAGDTVRSIKVAKPEACDQCHDEGTGEMLVPAWQEATKEAYNELRDKLKGTKEKMEQSSGLKNAQIKEMRKLFEEAMVLSEFVRTDGSWGVHNFEYAEALMQKAGNNLSKINKIIEKRR